MRIGILECFKETVDGLASVYLVDGIEYFYADRDILRIHLTSGDEVIYTGTVEELSAWMKKKIQ